MEKWEIFNDNFQNYKSRHLPKAHFVIADIPYNLGANASEFGKSIGNFNYHIQQALYSDILMANGLAVNGFVFVVVEKTPPYMVGFFTLSEKAVEFGRECYQNALDKIIALKAQNLEFPDFAGLSIDENGQINQKIIQEIDLPAWVYSKGA